jgi:hypothetical protein
MTKSEAAEEGPEPAIPAAVWLAQEDGSAETGGPQRPLCQQCGAPSVGQGHLKSESLNVATQFPPVVFCEACRRTSTMRFEPFEFWTT